MLVREGLQRLEGVESVGEQASHQTQTCEIRTRDGRLLQHDVLSQHILNLSVGARLRGIEATADGWVEKRGDDLLFRVSGTNEMLRLAPLAHMVQWDFKNKRPQPPSVEEIHAYESLNTAVKLKSARFLITGTVVKGGDSRVPILEVKRFKPYP